MRMKSRKILAPLMAAIACCVFLVPQHGVAQSELDALRAYEGTWKAETDYVESAHSRARHESATLRNECWKSGQYFVCDQFVNGESKALLVFTYNADKKIYASNPIMPNGEDAGSGTLIIQGNEWTFPWTSGDGDEKVYYRVVNVFVSAEKIEMREEYSNDGTTWKPMAHGVETRVAGS